ncbi:MAG: hypothetical protein LC772_04310 [Chloroflexi bacterium]|nr:hypothetical protein [Chloroflexota bacterium]
MRNLRLLPALLTLPLSAITCASARPPTLDPTYGLRAPAARPAAQVAGKGASWIWADHTANGQAIALRRDFDLSKRPSEAQPPVYSQYCSTQPGVSPRAAGTNW